MMHNGSIKKVQDIKVGDKIMGDDSTPRTILTLARGEETMYKVIPEQGDSYVVNESHILSLKCTQDTERYKKGDIIDMSVLDYLSLPKSYHGSSSPLQGFRVPIHFSEKKLEIEPYRFGYQSLHEKSSIPNKFKCNSRENRLQLLAGIIDSEGTIENNGYRIITKNENLLEDIIFLARSLGFAAYQKQQDK